MSVIVLMPAHNEAERIAASVTAAASVPGVDRVVVIDDGSTDGTTDIARTAGADVITLSHNLGKGGALQAGLDAVRAEADVIVLLDADLGATASQCDALLAPCLAGDGRHDRRPLPRPADPADSGS